MSRGVRRGRRRRLGSGEETSREVGRGAQMPHGVGWGADATSGRAVCGVQPQEQGAARGVCPDIRALALSFPNICQRSDVEAS